MSRRILVVDDEPEMIEIIACNLRDHGYEIQTALSAGEALAKARDFRPDLVLLDLMLKGLDGLSVCEILRADPFTAGVGVLIITGFVGENPRLNSFEVGADDFLAKPFTARELLAAVEHVLRVRKLKSHDTDPASEPAGLLRKPKRKRRRRKS